MKARAQFKFNNGSIIVCNLRGCSSGDIENKCEVIANRLNIPCRNGVYSWHVKFDETVPGLEFIRVNAEKRVSGFVYLVTFDAELKKVKRKNSVRIGGKDRFDVIYKLLPVADYCKFFNSRDLYI